MKYRLKYEVKPSEYSEVVYGDTDSCFVKMKTNALIEFNKIVDKYVDVLTLTETEQTLFDKAKTKSIEEAFEEGKLLAGKATKALFKKPIDLEFEKVYYPFILLSKKRYIDNYYGTSPHKIDFVEKKGVVLKRRDNPEIVKKVYNGVVNPILDHGSRGVKLSISFLKKQLSDLMNNNVDLNELVVTKTLSKGYGSYDKHGNLVFKNSDYKNFNIPHVALANKLRERDPGSAPVTNDRISYVFIETENPSAKLYEKVEDLQTAINKNMKIDVLYYVENQLKNPITEILSLIVDDVDTFFDSATKDYRDKRQKDIIQYKAKSKKDIIQYKAKSKLIKGQTSILKWLGKSEK